MTFDEMINAIKALGDDASYDIKDDVVIAVTLQDFVGFDEHWNEIMRDYDDEDAVDAFVKMLENKCDFAEGDFYRDYQFDGFAVELGYASYDI